MLKKSVSFSNLLLIGKEAVDFFVLNLLSEMVLGDPKCLHRFTMIYEPFPYYISILIIRMKLKKLRVNFIFFKMVGLIKGELISPPVMEFGLNDTVTNLS